MYEDAKPTKKHIYTAYSDFKGAFGGRDQWLLILPQRVGRRYDLEEAWSRELGT